MLLDKLQEESEFQVLLSKILFQLVQSSAEDLKNSKYDNCLAELCLALDKNSLVALLSLFGGQTITIPTITELSALISAMLIHNEMLNSNVGVRVAANTLSITLTPNIKYWLNQWKDLNNDEIN